MKGKIILLAFTTFFVLSSISAFACHGPGLMVNLGDVRATVLKPDGAQSTVFFKDINFYVTTPVTSPDITYYDYTLIGDAAEFQRQYSSKVIKTVVVKDATFSWEVFDPATYKMLKNMPNPDDALNWYLANNVYYFLVVPVYSLPPPSSITGDYLEIEKAIIYPLETAYKCPPDPTLNICSISASLPRVKECTKDNTNNFLSPCYYDPYTGTKNCPTFSSQAAENTLCALDGSNGQYVQCSKDSSSGATSCALSVSPSETADLAIQAIAINKQNNPDGTVTLNVDATIRNKGALGAGAFDVQIRALPPPSSGTEKISTVPVSSLLGNGAQTSVHTAFIIGSGGDYLISLLLDAGSLIRESNEMNNYYYEKVPISLPQAQQYSQIRVECYTPTQNEEICYVPLTEVPLKSDETSASPVAVKPVCYKPPQKTAVCGMPPIPKSMVTQPVSADMLQWLLKPMEVIIDALKYYVPAVVIKLPLEAQPA